MKGVVLVSLLLFFNIGTIFSQIYFPVWGESFGSGADESMNRITSDANDNIIYTAFFMDSTQIEIGGSNVDVVTMDWDYLLVKSDPNGSGLWYHLYPGNGQLFDVDVHGTDIYTTGLITSGTMDIDPGPGTLNVSSTTTSSFCQKLDENGNLIWGKGFTGSGQITAEDLATDDAGNVYISGEIYNGTIDIDPGPSTVNVTTSNRIMFVVKLDINGNYVWHHAYPGDDISITYLKTSPNYLYLYGTYQGTYDFDPGPGVDSETAVGNGDALLHKIDFSGNLIWSKRIGGLTGTDVWDRNSIENIVTDDQENIYMVGYYASDMDVDPNIGVTTIPGFCTDCARIFAAKWDVNGNYVWSYYTESSLAGGSRLVPNDIYLSSSNSALVFGGYAYYYPPFGTIDFLPGSGSFNQSFGEYGGSFFIHTDTSGNFIWSEMRTNQSIYDFSSSNDTVVIGGQFFETQNIGTPQSPIMVAATPNTFLPFNYPEGFMAKLYFEFGNLYANVFTTPTTNADSCDAFAYAFPIGGFPPYTFDWITQTDYDNSFELDSACYGIHTLLVMDSAGDSAFVDYYVAEDSGYSNWSYGIPSDTVYFIHENCLLDYSLPIDSAAITAFDYLMDDSLTTGQYFYGEVVYYQNGNVYTFGDTVLVDLDLNVLFFLSVYCPIKSIDKVKIILITTEGGFQNLEEQLHETFIMYPNPANTSITIDGINYESGSLSDLSGRIVKTWGGYSNKIDITELTPGIYIVTVYRNNEIVGLQKLIIQ